MKWILFVFSSLVASVEVSMAELEPILAVPDEVVFESDFDEPGKVDREQWAKRQATQWEIVDGVLRGRESTAENQAAKSHHRGLEPRLSCPITPAEFVMRFKVRFVEGEATTIVPFVEFGHHIVRVRIHPEEGTSLLADYETLKIAEAPGYKWESGKWYSALAELKGDEFVIQFEDGPTLYGQHPMFREPAPSGGIGFGLAGPRHGIAEVDDVVISTIQPDAQEGWEARKADFPEFEPVQVREHPKPKN